MDLVRGGIECNAAATSRSLQKSVFVHFGLLLPNKQQQDSRTKKEQTPLFSCSCSTFPVCRFHTHTCKEIIMLCLCVHGSVHAPATLHAHPVLRVREKKNKSLDIKEVS